MTCLLCAQGRGLVSMAQGSVTRTMHPCGLCTSHGMQGVVHAMSGTASVWPHGYTQLSGVCAVGSWLQRVPTEHQRSSCLACCSGLPQERDAVVIDERVATRLCLEERLWGSLRESFRAQCRVPGNILFSSTSRRRHPLDGWSVLCSKVHGQSFRGLGHHYCGRGEV